MRLKAIIITGIIVLMPASALATVASQSAQEKAQARTEAKQQNQQVRCTAITNRINSRITAANRRMDERKVREQTAIDHWNKLISRAEATPYNISAGDPIITNLQSDIGKLKAQIDTNVGDHQTYVTDLQSISSAGCGQRQDQRAQAKADFKTWSADWGKPKTIHKNVHADVVALLQKMKSIKKSNKSGTQ